MSGHAAEASGLMDRLEMDEAAALGNEIGLDVKTVVAEWISGEGSLVPDWRGLAERFLHSATQALRSVLPAVLLPLLAGALVRALLGRDGRAARFLFRVCCAGTLIGGFSDLARSAQHLTGALTRCADAFTPPLLTLIALSGGETTAAALSPYSAVAAELMETALGKWGAALSVCAACVAAAGNLSESMRLDQLFNLLRQTLLWGVAALMTLFLGAMTVQGRLSAARDTAAMRAAHYTVESIVPIIGGSVSDSLESVLAACRVVQNAVGIAGLTALVSLCAAPVLKAAGMVMALKLSAAAAEPLGDGAAVSLLNRFAGAAEMLLVTMLAAILLCGLLLGSCMSVATGGAGG